MRLESPSSINLYRQCPRKYFYQYITKLPTKPSIHLVRGSAVHTALEKFFKLNPELVKKEELKIVLLDNFRQAWEDNKGKLEKLNMNIHDKLFYFNDSKKMLENWIENLIEKMEKTGKEYIEAFNYLKPITEKQYHSETYNVRGFIDAIHEFEDGIHIYDYKTSKKDTMTSSYRLQLAIYALLYKLEHGIYPKKVGINFLKFGEKFLIVDEELVEEARVEIRKIHQSTQTKDKKDYPKKITPLCKWSTGQCDFYEKCIKDD